MSWEERESEHTLVFHRNEEGVYSARVGLIGVEIDPCENQARVSVYGREAEYPCDSDECPGNFEVGKCTLSTVDELYDCPFVSYIEEIESCVMLDYEFEEGSEGNIAAIVKEMILTDRDPADQKLDLPVADAFRMAIMDWQFEAAESREG